MIILPLSCTCSDLKVYPKNWMSAKVSIKKDWYVYYRFYDPVFDSICSLPVPKNLTKVQVIFITG